MHMHVSIDVEGYKQNSQKFSQNYYVFTCTLEESDEEVDDSLVLMTCIFLHCQ